MAPGDAAPGPGGTEATPAPATAATTGTVGPQGAPVAPEAHGADDGPMPPPPPDPEAEGRKKAILCGQVSQMLGIPVVRLVKITGKEPQYRMEMDDCQKIDFPNVNKLIIYDSVRSAIAAAVGKIIPKIKAKDWEVLSQVMLDACIIEQGTEEMEWEGAARMYLQHYLSETGFIPSIDGQGVQEQRRPMVIDGSIAVCASDLLIYINKTTFQALSVKAVAGMLSALGARSKRVRGLKFKDQSRWLLPFPEFDPAEYPQHGGAGVIVQ